MNPPQSATAKVDMSNSAEIERPLPTPPGTKQFGSDVIAEAIQALDIPYIALNPGRATRSA